MTREEFERDITTWDALKDFCWETNCTECDDVESSDGYNDWIEENVVEWARNETWQDLLAILSRYDEDAGYDWYIWNDYNSEYRPADDDDLDDYKNRVMGWADNEGIWDGDAEDEETETDDFWAERDTEPGPDPVDPEDIEPTPDEDCSFGEVFNASVSCIRTIREEALEQERQQGKAYALFMESVMSNVNKN